MAAKNARFTACPICCSLFYSAQIDRFRTQPYVSILKPEKTVRTPHIQSDNRPFARWRHFTTTTRVLFAFSFIFKFGNPSEV